VSAVRLLIVLPLLLALLPSAAVAQPACGFQLGFKAIAEQIPGMVGRCLEDEWHNASNGNTEQRTTAHHGQGGLLVWRKADNWTAFTDGHWTWVNGPAGLQRRLNAERFAWEGDAPAAAGPAAPAATSRDARQIRLQAGDLGSAWRQLPPGAVDAAQIAGSRFEPHAGRPDGLALVTSLVMLLPNPQIARTFDSLPTGSARRVDPPPLGDAAAAWFDDAGSTHTATVAVARGSDMVTATVRGDPGRATVETAARYVAVMLGRL
jgi:hypothetical protein